jgi:hypothetical protein
MAETKAPMLGTQADRIYALRAKRLLLEERVDALKKQETEAKDAIIRELASLKLESATGKHCTVSITKNALPAVKDWSAFHRYIIEHRALDLLEKRASKSACQAVWEAGETLPGVERTTVVSLSITKSHKEA